MPFCATCGRESVAFPFCPYCGRPGADVQALREGQLPSPPLSHLDPVGKAAALPHSGVLIFGLAAALGFCAAAASAFLPWIEDSGVRVSGLDRNGRLTLAVGLIGFLFCLLAMALRSRWPFVPVMIAGLTVSSVALLEIVDLTRSTALSIADAGPALWISTAAGIVAVVAGAGGASLTRSPTQG